MGFWLKVKELKLWKQRAFRFMLGAEAALLMAGILNLFGKDAVYEYGIGSIQANRGTYLEEAGGVCIEGGGTEDNLIEFSGIVLPRGTYRLQIHYDVDVNSIHYYNIADEKEESERLQCNGGMLYADLHQTDTEVWANKKITDARVYVRYGGEGRLVVSGLTIQQTNAMARTDLFCLLCLLALGNGIYVYIRYDKAYRIEVKKKKVAFCLGVITVLASLPLLVDYVFPAGDLGYHLMRVEGIKDSLLAGVFPVRISPEWQQGYGYASPIFYGETILYPAGLLRLIGFSVTASYRIFMLAIVFATVLIAYCAFTKIFGEAYVGVFCSLLYSLSVYRIYKTYICGSLGESLGIMLLPLLVYGFWRVFTQDICSKEYARSWVPLTIGFTLLLQSHLLSCELVGFFTILLCIVLWRRVFRWPTFLVLAKTVVYTILLSAWFLVPFLDYMLTGDFVIQHVSARRIQYRGLYPAHLLFTWPRSGSGVFFDQQGMYDSAPMGIGVVLIVALVVFICLVFNRRLEHIKEEKGLGILLGTFGVLSMCMSLSSFPWDRIQDLGQVTATLVSSIQFPNRLLMIANVCLTAVAGIMVKYALTEGSRKFCVGYVCGICLLLVVGSVYLMEDITWELPPIKFYNSQGMGTGYIAGGEYLPYGVNPALFIYHDPVCTGDLEAREYEKGPLKAEAHLVNPGDKTESASFALLYYKGYRARAVPEGIALKCYAGENGEVTVDIPAGFDGRLTVGFESPWYWRLGEAVTLLVILIMAGDAVRRKKIVCSIKDGTAAEAACLEVCAKGVSS